MPPLCRVIFFLFHAREKRKVGMIFDLDFTFTFIFFFLTSAALGDTISLSLCLSFYYLLFLKRPFPSYDDDYEFPLSCTI